MNVWTPSSPSSVSDAIVQVHCCPSGGCERCNRLAARCFVLLQPLRNNTDGGVLDTPLYLAGYGKGLIKYDSQIVSPEPPIQYFERLAKLHWTT